MKTLSEMNKDMLIKLILSTEERHQNELKCWKFIAHHCGAGIVAKCYFENCPGILTYINGQTLPYECSEMSRCCNCFHYYCNNHHDSHLSICSTPFPPDFNTRAFFKHVSFNHFHKVISTNKYLTKPFSFLVVKEQNGDVTVNHRVFEKGEVLLTDSERKFVDNNLPKFKEKLDKWLYDRNEIPYFNRILK